MICLDNFFLAITSVECAHIINGCPLFGDRECPNILIPASVPNGCINFSQPGMECTDKEDSKGPPFLCCGLPQSKCTHADKHTPVGTCQNLCLYYLIRHMFLRLPELSVMKQSFKLLCSSVSSTKMSLCGFCT